MAYHPISPNIQSFLTPQQNAQHSVLSRFAIVRHPFPVMFKPFSSNFPVIVYHFPHEISRCPMIFPIIFASFPAFQSFSSDFPMKCPSKNRSFLSLNLGRKNRAFSLGHLQSRPRRCRSSWGDHWERGTCHLW